MVGFKDTHKIADKWGEEVYVVVKQTSLDMPVFEVKPDDGLEELKRYIGAYSFAKQSKS